MWRSLVARVLWEHEVGGSNPLIPTRKEIFMTDNDREKLMAALLKSEEIKGIYEDYIVKDIPFETWVRDTASRLLKGV